ncbi:AP2 domain transcription factor AP2XII-9 [Besnoitia besnoiti]|uniref:AP2 domain transcription factor AP2XII-9 n=1 Tax=Besnoitia besnoiti TaxID=94643 RepID=A0A2A9M724_BESBE|nr:AP2 domain transcription factor AP2XII-9 [Besnoitia besnoiti]PFH31443.1 AP2 domain transcription factor AP2XII-9 [Besnoitia besnoiti]
MMQHMVSSPPLQSRGGQAVGAFEGDPWRRGPTPASAAPSRCTPTVSASMYPTSCTPPTAASHSTCSSSLSPSPHNARYSPAPPEYQGGHVSRQAFSAEAAPAFASDVASFQGGAVLVRGRSVGDAREFAAASFASREESFIAHYASPPQAPVLAPEGDGLPWAPAAASTYPGDQAPWGGNSLGRGKGKGRCGQQAVTQQGFVTTHYSGTEGTAQYAYESYSRPHSGFPEAPMPKQAESEGMQRASNPALPSPTETAPRGATTCASNEQASACCGVPSKAPAGLYYEWNYPPRSAPFNYAPSYSNEYGHPTSFSEYPGHPAVAQQSHSAFFPSASAPAGEGFYAAQPSECLSSAFATANAQPPAPLSPSSRPPAPGQRGCTAETPVYANASSPSPKSQVKRNVARSRPRSENPRSRKRSPKAPRRSPQPGARAPKSSSNAAVGGSTRPVRGLPLQQRKLYRHFARQTPRVQGLTFDHNQIRWISYWKNDQGRQIQRHFPVSRHGFLEARRLALEERNRILGWPLHTDEAAEAIEALKASADPFVQQLLLCPPSVSASASVSTNLQEAAGCSLLDEHAFSACALGEDGAERQGEREASCATWGGAEDDRESRQGKGKRRVRPAEGGLGTEQGVADPEGEEGLEEPCGEGEAEEPRGSGCDKGAGLQAQTCEELAESRVDRAGHGKVPLADSSLQWGSDFQQENASVKHENQPQDASQMQQHLLACGELTPRQKTYEGVPAPQTPEQAEDDEDQLLSHRRKKTSKEKEERDPAGTPNPYSHASTGPSRAPLPDSYAASLSDPSSISAPHGSLAGAASSAAASAAFSALAPPTDVGDEGRAKPRRPAQRAPAARKQGEEKTRRSSGSRKRSAKNALSSCVSPTTSSCSQYSAHGVAPLAAPYTLSITPASPTRRASLFGDAVSFSSPSLSLPANEPTYQPVSQELASCYAPSVAAAHPGALSTPEHSFSQAISHSSPDSQNLAPRYREVQPRSFSAPSASLCVAAAPVCFAPPRPSSLAPQFAAHSAAPSAPASSLPRRPVFLEPPFASFSASAGLLWANPQEELLQLQQLEQEAEAVAGKALCRKRKKTKAPGALRVRSDSAAKPRDLRAKKTEQTPAEPNVPSVEPEAAGSDDEPQGTPRHAEGGDLHSSAETHALPPSLAASFPHTASPHLRFPATPSRRASVEGCLGAANALACTPAAASPSCVSSPFRTLSEGGDAFAADQAAPPALYDGLRENGLPSDQQAAADRKATAPAAGEGLPPEALGYPSKGSDKTLYDVPRTTSASALSDSPFASGPFFAAGVASFASCKTAPFAAGASQLFCAAATTTTTDGCTTQLPPASFGAKPGSAVVKRRNSSAFPASLSRSSTCFDISAAPLTPSAARDEVDAAARLQPEEDGGRLASTTDRDETAPEKAGFPWLEDAAHPRRRALLEGSAAEGGRQQIGDLEALAGAETPLCKVSENARLRSSLPQLSTASGSLRLPSLPRCETTTTEDSAYGGLSAFVAPCTAPRDFSPCLSFPRRKNDQAACMRRKSAGSGFAPPSTSSLLLVPSSPSHEACWSHFSDSDARLCATMRREDCFFPPPSVAAFSTASLASLSSLPAGPHSLAQHLCLSSAAAAGYPDSTPKQRAIQALCGASELGRRPSFSVLSESVHEEGARPAHPELFGSPVVVSSFRTSKMRRTISTEGSVFLPRRLSEKLDEEEVFSGSRLPFYSEVSEDERRGEGRKRGRRASRRHTRTRVSVSGVSPHRHPDSLFLSSLGAFPPHMRPSLLFRHKEGRTTCRRSSALCRDDTLTASSEEPLAHVAFSGVHPPATRSTAPYRLSTDDSPFGDFFASVANPPGSAFPLLRTSSSSLLSKAAQATTPFVASHAGCMSRLISLGDAGGRTVSSVSSARGALDDSARRDTRFLLREETTAELSVFEENFEKSAFPDVAQSAFPLRPAALSRPEGTPQEGDARSVAVPALSAALAPRVSASGPSENSLLMSPRFLPSLPSPLMPPGGGADSAEAHAFAPPLPASHRRSSDFLSSSALPPPLAFLETPGEGARQSLPAFLPALSLPCGSPAALGMPRLSSTSASGAPFVPQSPELSSTSKRNSCNVVVFSVSEQTSVAVSPHPSA